MNLLMEINAAGTTILMVTHNPELAQLVHRQLHIVDGRIDQIQHFKPLQQPLQGVSSAAG
jgi:putative ABC transport system ATP-binding protein